MRSVLNLIDGIYESALDADKWPDLLAQATRYFKARGAQIGNTDLVNSRLSFSLVHGYDWSIEHFQRYERLMNEDPRLRYFSANPFKPVHCRMELTDEEIRSTRVYKEVLSVGGVEYSLGVNFVEDGRALSYFLILRDASMPPFSQEDCDKLAVLIPHLARALRLQRELDTMSFERKVGFSTLDSMALGVVIADAEGRVRFRNALAGQWLDRADGLKVEGDRLRGTTDSGRDVVDELHAAIEARPAALGRPTRALRLRRTSGGEPYMVVISPIKAEDRQLSGNARADRLAVLFIRDPDHVQETKVELLQRLYGLTHSEARLSDLVSLGRPLKKAADLLGLTEATARQYIKQAFKKTGVHGQPELVRKVMSLPPGISFDPEPDGGVLEP